MPRESEMYSTELHDFSYADACSEIYNKLHLSPPNFSNNYPEESQNRDDMSPKEVNFRESEVSKEYERRHKPSY